MAESDGLGDGTGLKDNMTRGRGVDLYANAFRISRDELLERIKEDSKRGVVVDLGAGMGNLAKESGLNIRSFDMEPLALHVEQAHFSDLPLKNNSVSLAMAVCSLGYYAENEDQLNRDFVELQRVLQDDGKAIIVVNPDMNYFAHGDIPEASKYDQGALSAQRQIIIRPSQYANVMNRAFTIDLSEIVDRSGLEVVARGRTGDLEGIRGKVWWELRKIESAKSNIQQEIKKKAELWEKSGQTPEAAAAIVEEVASLVSSERVELKGRMADYFSNTGNYYRLPSAHHGAPEAVMLLGQENPEVLHVIATKYFKDLVQRAETDKGGFYDNDALANLTLIQLAELHRQGKYGSEQMTVLVDLVQQVLENADKLRDPWFPPMWGLNDFMQEVMADSSLVDRGWEVIRLATEKHIPPQPPYGDQLWELNMRLFDVAAAQQELTSGQIELLSNFFIMENFGSSVYSHLLNTNLFIRVIEKEVERNGYLNWFKQEIEVQMSQNGVATRLIDLMRSNPSENFKGLFPALYAASVWIPSQERELAAAAIGSIKGKDNQTLTNQGLEACINAWGDLSGDTRAYLEWMQLVGPDFVAQGKFFPRRSDQNPDRLINLTRLVRNSGFPLTDQDHRKRALWVPYIGEVLMGEVAGSSVSFAGNIIMDVEGLSRSGRMSDKVQGLLSTIHSHLHMSEVAKASIYIEGIYSCLEGKIDEFRGIAADEIKKLMEIPEIRYNMDLIRSQTNPEFSKGPQVDRFMTGINFARKAAEIDKYNPDSRFLDFTEKVEDLIGENLTPENVVEIVRFLSEYNGPSKGYMLPITLATRSYFLDSGLDVPVGVESEEWLSSAITLAGMTGEIAPELVYAWKRKGFASRKEIVIGLTEDYKEIAKVQNSLRGMGLNEGQVADTYRGVTSRSMTDLIIRFFNQHTNRQSK